MILHPFLPPPLWFYVFVALAIGLITAVVLRRKFHPLWIFISTTSAFLPLVLGAIWFYWAHARIGSSGYVGARDSREIFQALEGSFFQGAVFTALLLIFDGVLLWKMGKNDRWGSVIDAR